MDGTIAQRQLIRNLLSKGMTIEEIAEVTKLSPEKVTQLINQHEQQLSSAIAK